MAEQASGHPAGWPEPMLLRQVTLRTARGSGPGGQHRNKTESAVVARHEPTGLEASAGERREQARNRAAALFRLRLKLAVALRCPAADSPSELWRQRCGGPLVRVNPEHADYPALLAEALDQLTHAGGQVGDAAAALGCSASQLQRFIRQHPPAWVQLNELRKAVGLAPLR